MPRGGKRPGAGRPKGGRNQLTKESVAKAEKLGITPLEFLTRIYQDESQDDKMRVDAAKAAAPYVHPKLNNVELTGSMAVMSHEEMLRQLDD